MIVSKVCTHLKMNKRAALQDMAAQLDMSPDALKSLLTRLEYKGHVRRLPEHATCGGGCSKCAPQSVELYEWAGQ